MLERMSEIGESKSFIPDPPDAGLLVLSALSMFDGILRSQMTSKEKPPLPPDEQLDATTDIVS